MLKEDAASATLIDELVRLAPGGGAVTVLKETRVLVVRVGDVVIKAHPPGTVERDLRSRLDAARGLPGVMLAPLALERLENLERRERPERREHPEHPVGRLVTIWPAGEALSPDDLADGTMPEDAWEEGARLLARLHATPPPRGMPQAGGPERLGKAMAELARVADSADTRQIRHVMRIRQAYQTLAGPLRAADQRLLSPGARLALTHGDWHLGQLVRHEGAWLLIDPDDLGVGDPAWDLARPAAWFASGLLDPDLWHSFLSAYIGAGGTAVSHDDPWRELDLPARALTVQLAATAVVTAMRAGSAPDEVAVALVSSCGRIVAAAG
ncbi:aminoglycoside phosphotransferase [Planotetraspora silvatica]|uniref:Aminoglycoside phosphotransferase n=1 Tax=Planotetraspora silvatica TaxID=234614 RepID=A0A8J3XS44_9ACTN|nr:aminoglycoside phosphotransferase family protein [Planotetraspora silvatica]GII50121.1 aminoglycoside phosphotransferase [Planotetraspora silvatica]